MAGLLQKLPAAHGFCPADPVGQKVPCAQARHETELLTPEPVEKVPAEQAAQVPLEAAPSAVEKVPATQATQVEFETAPEATE